MRHLFSACRQTAASVRCAFPRFTLALWPRLRTRKRWRRAFRRAAVPVRVVIVVIAALTLSLGINWAYQLVRKPSELFFPVSVSLYKTPAETWARYAPLFRQYSTASITPDLLAALAQVEASGNPVVRTYWRWAFDSHPFSIYRPASSAVGMYQITDGTFAEARHYCVRDHVVVQEGAWNDRHACRFNGLYSRVIPAHAVELTAAELTLQVGRILKQHHLEGGSLAHRRTLATVIHLCGAGTGDLYASREFKLLEGQRCGDHRVADYVSKVNIMRLTFDRLAAEQGD